MASSSVIPTRHFFAEWDTSISMLAREMCKKDVLEEKDIETITGTIDDKIRGVLREVVEFPRRQVFFEFNLFKNSLECLPDQLDAAISQEIAKGKYSSKQVQKINAVFARLKVNLFEMQQNYEAYKNKCQKPLAEFYHNFNSPGYAGVLRRIQPISSFGYHGRIYQVGVDSLILRGFKSDFAHHIEFQRSEYRKEIKCYVNKSASKINIFNFKKAVVELKMDFPSLSRVDIEFDLRRALSAQHGQEFKTLSEHLKDPTSALYKKVEQSVLDRHGFGAKKLVDSYDAMIAQYQDLNNKMISIYDELETLYELSVQKEKERPLQFDDKRNRIIMNPDEETMRILDKYNKKRAEFEQLEALSEVLSQRLDTARFFQQEVKDNADRISAFYEKLATPMRYISGYISEEHQSDYREALFNSMHALIRPFPSLQSSSSSSSST